MQSRDMTSTSELSPVVSPPWFCLRDFLVTKKSLGYSPLLVILSLHRSSGLHSKHSKTRSKLSSSMRTGIEHYASDCTT